MSVAAKTIAITGEPSTVRRYLARPDCHSALWFPAGYCHVPLGSRCTRFALLVACTACCGSIGAVATFPNQIQPPLRLILVWDNLAGHLSWAIVRWLLAQGVMPLYTPRGYAGSGHRKPPHPARVAEIADRHRTTDQQHTRVRDHVLIVLRPDHWFSTPRSAALIADPDGGEAEEERTEDETKGPFRHLAGSLTLAHARPPSSS